MDGTPAQEVIIQQQRHVFEGHTARIFSLALCTLANGNRIAASASHDRTVRIWCLTTNSHIRTLTYKDFVWRVFLVTTAIGRVCVIAFVSAIDNIHVSDFETGEEMYVVQGRLVYAGIISLYNSPVIVTLINDVDLAIVDAETGVYIRYIRGGFEKAFRAVVSSTSHPVLVFNTWNAQNRRSSIQAYQLFVDPSEAELQILPRFGKMVTNLTKCTWTCFQGPARDEAMVPTNMRIVFEGDSRDGITSLVISQTAKPVICSGHYDNVVRVWDLATLNLLLVLEGHYDWVVSVTVWKGIEPLVISGSSDGTIKVWDLENGNLICTCEGHLRDVWAVTVTTGPRHLIVSASADRTVRSWDINNVLADMRWSRRSNFAMFLACYGIVSRPSCHGYAPVRSFSSAAATILDSPLENSSEEIGTRLVEQTTAARSVSAAVGNIEELDFDKEIEELALESINLAVDQHLLTKSTNQLIELASFNQWETPCEKAEPVLINSSFSKNCEAATLSVFHNFHLLKEIASYI